MRKKYPLVVLDRDTKTPFLRGHLTHSLLKRGLSFKDAYAVASSIRSQFLQRGKVTLEELRETVSELVLREYDLNIQVEIPKLIPPQIRVEDGQAVPFSKGILTRSLQAAGLDPSVGYTVALQVQETLLSSAQKSVRRKKLRRLIYETLAEFHGQKIAERYLLWRYVHSPSRPIILLFGGSSGAGKTLLATDVAHRLGISQVVSTDSVREIMRMMFSRDLFPGIHYSSYEAWKSGEFRSEERLGVIEAFRQQALRVLVGVSALLERATQEKNSMVIEGVHLVPGLLDVDHLSKDAQIVNVVIANLDRDDYLQRFPDREKTEGARPAEHYMNNIDSILEIQDYILEKAHEIQTPIVENNTNEDAVPKLLEVIADGLRERLNLGGEELVKHAL
jgi:2-phosphoglycerate kinase